jgi:hypothetical protein
MIRTLSADPALQKVVRFHALPDGRFVVETLYDAQSIVDRAAAIRAMNPSGWKGDFHHVGTIPMPLHQQLRAEGRMEDPKDLLKWLNAHEKLRTKGRL